MENDMEITLAKYHRKSRLNTFNTCINISSTSTTPKTFRNLQL